MTSKLLQALGVLSILALVGGAIAGFSVLKDRVRLIVEADSTEVGPDPTALLRDDVEQLAGELTTLQKAVGSNFERLANGLEGSADTRHADVLQLLAEVRQLTGKVEQLTASQSNAKSQLAALATAVHESSKQIRAQRQSADRQLLATQVPEVADQQTAKADPVAAKPKPPIVLTKNEAPKPAAKPQPTAPGKTKKAKGGFLSFSIPKTELALDKPTNYSLLPKLCRVGFDAKSTLHDFTGVTSAVTGSFRADFDDPDGLCTGEVVVKASTLKTGVDGRDTNMWSYLDTDKHPEIKFAVTKLATSPQQVDLKANTVAGDIVGKMTIRGKTRDFRVPVKIEVDTRQRVVITGSAKLKLSDYEVPVPSQLGVINMEDEVVVWLALRARMQSGNRK